MATITLTGGTFGCTMGMGVFEGIGVAFTSAKSSSSVLSKALGTLKSKIDLASVAAKVETSQEQTHKAEEREFAKKSSLSLAYEKLNTLIADTGSVDMKASSKIRERKDAFYDRYYYLKPECEKNRREKVKDAIKKGWDGLCSIGNAIKNFALDVVEWVKEHWKEILVGIAFIVVGALITVFTAGTGTAFWAAFGAALAKGIATALIAGAIGGSVNAGITYGIARLSGASPQEARLLAKKAFGDGFAAGFMMGGIGFAGGAFGSAFGTSYKAFRAIQYTAKISGTISLGMAGFDLVSQIAGLINPDSKLLAFNKSLHNNNFYNGFQKGITGLAVFSGAAYSKAEITDGSHMYMNENGDMVPRGHVKYSSGEDGTTYHYVTGRKGENGAGLIKEGYADKLDLKTDGRGRYVNDRNTPGKLPGDDAGHIFGDRFNGSRKLDNLTSQSSDVNQLRRGQFTYRSMEDQWANTLKNNGSVTDVKVKINYSWGSSRPSSYKVTYNMNGDAFKTIFQNIGLTK